MIKILALTLSLLLTLVAESRSKLVCYSPKFEEVREQTRLVEGKKSTVIGRGFFTVVENVSQSGLMTGFDSMFQILTNSICEPNKPIAKLSRIPDDELFRAQRAALSRINALKAWKISTGSGRTIVAMIDSGIDVDHDDLFANIFRNGNDIINGLDDDENGYVDDYFGPNTLTMTGDLTDTVGHGTHVSGIAGARGNNLIGISGVAWQTRILHVKITDGEDIYLEPLVRGLNYILDLKRKRHPIRVLNVSLAGYERSTLIEMLMNRLFNADILVVAGVGNDGLNLDTTPSYPAMYPHVVSVASVKLTNNRVSISDFSNYGSRVTTSAPGEGILSTLPNLEYGRASGTSMAAPHVAGALALYFSVHPRGTARQALEDIRKACTHITSLRNKVARGCLLDAYKLVKFARDRAQKSKKKRKRR